MKDDTVLFRIYYRELGGHTHMRVFVTMSGRNFGKAGDLTMTNEEFVAWQGKRDKFMFIKESETDL